MTKLIFRSGLRTIGGTIVEVIDGKERIIFDFGTVFDGQGKRDVEPMLDGIYDNTSKYNDMVLISHLHLDHTKAMNLIDKSIPIYMNDKSIEFLEDLYKIEYNEFLGEKRLYSKIANKETITHGNFKITNLLVDHDVFGASSFLIQTNDLNLFYSGDIRLHGLNKDYTYEMIDYIKGLNEQIDVAIFEGVTISFIEDDYKIIPTNETLRELDEENFADIVIETIQEKQILVNPYIMGMERVKSIFSLANKLKKKVAITNDFAYLVNKYYPTLDFLIIGKDIYNLNKKVISYDSLNEEYIIFWNYKNKEKYPISMSKSALLQIGGEPLGDFDARWSDFVDFCENRNMKIYKIGGGGHATPENLIYIIDEINPKLLMPLHSFKPELVKSTSAIQILPKVDMEYKFTNNKLKEK